MPNPPPSSLRLTVDRNALTQNWRTLDTMSGAASAGAAVKANAYGLGLGQAVPALVDAGCAAFFVAHWSEAYDMLDHVPAAKISVLHGPRNSEDAQFAAGTGIKPVINSTYQAQLWSNAGGGLCDLMIDTGINRLGISPSEVADPWIAALCLDTVMSHLASADEDSAFNQTQLERFIEATAPLSYQSRSLANSAGIALGSNYAFDLTRPGLALYGGVPHPALEGLIKPVAGLQAAILQTRTLQAGDTVGYNAIFTAPKVMSVAVVSLGYADGYLRSWGGRGALTFEGTILPVLGKISMDMIVVDISNAANCKEGDWLEIPYDLPVAAQQSGLSQYELLTVLGHRFAC